MDQTVTLSNRALTDHGILTKELESELRKSISQAVFYDTHRIIDRDIYVMFGITYPEIIIDRSTGPILKYVSIDSVFTVVVENGNPEVRIPSRDAVAKDFNMKKENMIHTAENLLVANIGDRLLKIPKVQNGLNPIKEILVYLFDNHVLPVADVHRRKGVEKGKHYLEFLSALEFISIDGPDIYPGNALTKFKLANVGIETFTQKVLNDVILRGYQYLRDKLRIFILTPYLELTNAYYLPAFLVDSLLTMDSCDIERHYSNMYHLCIGNLA